jgi:hypothetical protein
MTTGKIEYSPDYKSRSQSLSARIAERARIVAKGLETQTEHARLQSVVVEKARAFGRAWRAELEHRIATLKPSEQLNHVATEARIQLCDAVDDLIAFEKEHKIGE